MSPQEFWVVADERKAIADENKPEEKVGVLPRRVFDELRGMLDA